MPDPTTVPCQECAVELAGDSFELRIELTCDDEPIVYRAERGGEGTRRGV